MRWTPKGRRADLRARAERIAEGRRLLAGIIVAEVLTVATPGLFTEWPEGREDYFRRVTLPTFRKRQRER